MRPGEDCALVMGGAESFFPDLMAALLLIDSEVWPGPVVAANDIGTYWPRRLDHWVSRHPDRLTGKEFKTSWAEDRMRRGLNSDYETWSIRGPRLVNHVIEDWKGMDSGLLGLRVALLELGIPRAVLVGMPMTKTPHFDGRKQGRPWRHAHIHWKAWLRNQSLLRGRTKSMSGNTREVFGAPTKEWILEGKPVPRKAREEEGRSDDGR